MTASRKSPRAGQRDAKRRLLYAALGFAALVLAFTAAWHWTPLHHYVEPRAIAHWLRSMARTPWMPFVIAFLYVAASFVMFPNTVLCLAVVMSLGPVWGAGYAFAGSLAAALVGYAIGRRGGERVEKLKVGAVAKASHELRHGGFSRILALRLLPVVPFSATNILSGAARAPLLPYVGATLVGTSPYILAFAAFRRQARHLFTDPSPTDAAVAFAIAAAASLLLWQARSWATAHSK